MAKKVQEMEFRIDQEGILIYNIVEEMSAGRSREGGAEEIDVVLAQGEEDEKHV